MGITQKALISRKFRLDSIDSDGDYYELFETTYHKHLRVCMFLNGSILVQICQHGNKIDCLNCRSLEHLDQLISLFITR